MNDENFEEFQKVCIAYVLLSTTYDLIQKAVDLLEGVQHADEDGDVVEYGKARQAFLKWMRDYTLLLENDEEKVANSIRILLVVDP